jgi:hypothetical protein
MGELGPYGLKPEQTDETVTMVVRAGSTKGNPVGRHLILEAAT